MRLSFILLLSCLALLVLPLACVDPEDLALRGTVDVIVVDGTLTNRIEPQIITLNRSKADPLTGRFGSLPIIKAKVEVVVDSAQTVTCHETVDGTYQLPSDFRGQTGHAYQLRVTLSNGSRYVSDQQIMPVVAPIEKLSVRFNPTSLPADQYPRRFRAGYDFFVTAKDPPEQRNYYRWDWKLWEKQKWCRSCYQGEYVDTVQQGYLRNGVYMFARQPVEDCVPPLVKPTTEYHNEYICRSQCWDILRNYTLTIFDDQLTNGGLLSNRQVAQVPLFTRQPALVEIRQASLTAGAYRFYQLFQQQTQNTGGLADTPPTAVVGNVHNVANPREAVIGYFTASAVAATRHWLDKTDATTLSLGAYNEKGEIVQSDDELFFVQTTRLPTQGPEGLPFTPGGPKRYITALCLPADGRTPVRPDGWRN